MKKEPTLEQLHRQIATANKRIAELSAESKARAEADNRAAEADKRMSRLDKQPDGFGNIRYKELLDTRLLCGIRVDNLHPNLKSEFHFCEFDIVVISADKVVVLEAKRNLTVASVREFVGRQLPLFAKAFPGMAQGKKVLGAMVYERTPPGGKAVRAALNAGLYVLCATSNRQLRQIKSAEDIPERQKPAPR